MNQALYDYMEYPKTCAPNDFWGQVRRTVHNKPIPQEQIQMIFTMIRRALNFKKSDVLLDIACGNGRLGFEFFDEVKEYLGMDQSPVLIEIGQKNFERPPNHVFRLEGVAEYCKMEANPACFTKALCFGAFSYFSEPDAGEMLSLLRDRFTGLETLFIGNIPDRERADNFYSSGYPQSHSLDDHTSAIGRWYRRDNLAALAKKTGWDATIADPPANYYQSHYRFNAILNPSQ
jgi:SAM-dependent methyltransferase